MPLVSVVIPTNNRSNYLKRAIDSVLVQSFQDFEIIIVDDNSVDDTQDIVFSFSDKRIRYIKNYKNLKAPMSRNIGICNAKGKYIALLDDDDYWHPNKLEMQVKKFSEVSRKVGVVYTGFSVINEDDNSIIRKIYPKKKGIVFNALLDSNILGSPTPLIKRELLFRSGLFDRKYQSAQDWDLWIRLSMITEFDFVYEILAYYSLHGRQISGDLVKKDVSIGNIINKYKCFYAKAPHALATQYKRRAVLNMINGNIRKSRIFAFKAYSKNFLRYDTFAHLIFSCCPIAYKYYIIKTLSINYNKKAKSIILY